MVVFLLSQKAEQDFRQRYPALFQEIVALERREAQSITVVRRANSEPHARAPWSMEEDRRAKIRELRRQFIPCPKGLHKATYRRLLRRHDHVLVTLDGIPFRRTWPIVRQRIETQLLNRLYRIRRRLGLRVPAPPTRPWYRIGAAAALLCISPKTLLRWTAKGRIACERSPWGKRQRRYRRADLVALLKELST
jgi:hypothetical protein